MTTTLHETRASLSGEALDVKRAIDSMREELEAIDWYGQRAEAASDPALRELLRHHRREEIEHFAMLLEWLRRHSPEMDSELRKVLFSERDIVAAGDGAPATRAGGDIGSGDQARLGSLIGEGGCRAG